MTGSATCSPCKHRGSTHAKASADRILVLDNGGISAIGTHRELMEESELYRDIFNSQLKEGGESA